MRELLLLAALATSAFGCASSAEGSTTEDDATTPVPAGTLRVVVKAGPKTTAAAGALVVAPYASCPPAGPPADLKFARVEQPTYPRTTELSGMKPGTYHVLAYVGAGMQPAAADPQVCSASAVTLTEREGATIDVALP
jgi:hypothetical protein